MSSPVLETYKHSLIYLLKTTLCDYYSLNEKTEAWRGSIIMPSELALIWAYFLFPWVELGKKSGPPPTKKKPSWNIGKPPATSCSPKIQWGRKERISGPREESGITTVYNSMLNSTPCWRQTYLRACKSQKRNWVLLCLAWGGLGEVVLARPSTGLRGTSIVAQPGSKNCWLRPSQRSSHLAPSLCSPGF